MGPARCQWITEGLKAREAGLSEVDIERYRSLPEYRENDAGASGLSLCDKLRRAEGRGRKVGGSASSGARVCGVYGLCRRVFGGVRREYKKRERQRGRREERMRWEGEGRGGEEEVEM